MTDPVGLIFVTEATPERCPRLSRMMMFQLRITSAATGSSGRWTDCVSIASGSVTEAIEQSLVIAAEASSSGGSVATLHDPVGRLLWKAEPSEIVEESPVITAAPEKSAPR